MRPKVSPVADTVTLSVALISVNPATATSFTPLGSTTLPTVPGSTP